MVQMRKWNDDLNNGEKSRYCRYLVGLPNAVIMKLTLFLAGLLLTFSATAKIWIVDSNAGSTAKDFTTLQAAHDGAAAGDTLYMIGSPNNYITGKVVFTKRLIVIGPGYFLNENPDTQASIAVAFVDSQVPLQCEELNFGPGSDGSAIMGMVILGRIVITTNNILIKRNYISQTGGCASTALDISGSNVMVVQNFFDPGTLNTGSSDVNVNAGFSNVLILNNYFAHNCAGCGAGVAAITSSGSSIEVSNNYILAATIVTNATVQNNIFNNGNTFSATSSIVRNNLHVGNVLPGGNGNQNNVNMSNVFLFSGTTDGRYQLKAASPAIGAGFGGVDAGMFGGAEPYVLSGIPPVPAIYSITAPLVGDKQLGLPVQVKVKSRN
jgi:hypothetical protein